MVPFKVDENLPAEVAALLAAAGHDALTVPQQRLAGRPDRDIASVCRQEGRALLTLDLDFADIRAFPPAQYAGLVVLRLHRLDKPRILAIVQRLIAVLALEPVAGQLWIVEETCIRIRD